MNFSALFIQRPVMTTLVMASILIAGILSYHKLPVSDLPNVDFPTILVDARLSGASPENMAASVATPLERQFSTIAGLASMSSTSALGATQITLQFDLDRDLDAAAQDVQAAIQRTASRLPKDMPNPPTFRKVNPADQPILYFSLTSPTLPLYALNEYGETMLAQRISTLKGVAQVQVFGAQKYAVRIQVDPQALNGRGLGIDEVSRAVAKANANLPSGVLYGPTQAFTVQAKGQLMEAAGFSPLIVAWRNGKPVRLEDIATAVDSVENDKVAAWYVNQRAIVLAVQKQPGANTVKVAQTVKALLPVFEKQLPASVSLHVLFDRSVSIQESIHDIQFTLLLSLALVVMVIFLFLRRVTATLIPSLAIPMSLVGALTVMYLMGYSLNNISLMALILSVGFVVDDAIVVLENIVRHREMGKSVWDAALDGSRQITFTVVSMTLSLAAVFIPVLLMGGIVGRLFREFAVSIAAAVLISGLVSLTLTPMLSSLLIGGRPKKQGRWFALSERFFDGMLAAYAALLRWFIAHRATAMVFTAAVLVATWALFRTLPTGFIPSEDTSQLTIVTEAAEGASLEAMTRYHQALAAILQADPNVEAFMTSVGPRGASGRANAGTFFVRLKPLGQRRLKDEQVLAQLRPKLAQVPGIRVFMQIPPPIRIGGMVTKSLYQCTLQGSETEELFHHAQVLEARMRALPGLMDVTTDLQLKNPEVTVDIDRDRAVMMGLSVEQIQDALYTAYGSRQISSIYAANDEYQVILEVKPEYSRSMDALALLHVRATSGQLVPLAAVTRLRQTVGPAAVNHMGQLPAVTISFNLRPGTSLGQAVNQIGEITRASLPPTINVNFQGTARAFRDSMADMGFLIFMAVVVMYMVLGILYESFIHPITILSALPFAGFGALVTLLIFNSELNIYAFVGIIMLIGIVKKNGIMMVDFALEAMAAYKIGPAEAIYQACLVRFRPIMMTTMAALMGTLPIALGYGAGGDARQPLGLAVVGGLIFSQFLTLFVTPVFFLYMEALRHLGRGKRGRPVIVASGGEAKEALK